MGAELIDDRSPAIKRAQASEKFYQRWGGYFGIAAFLALGLDVSWILDDGFGWDDAALTSVVAVLGFISFLQYRQAAKHGWHKPQYVH